MDRKRMIARIKAVTAGLREPSTPTPEDKATKLARSFKGKIGGVNSGQEITAKCLAVDYGWNSKWKYVGIVNTWCIDYTCWELAPINNRKNHLPEWL